VQQNTNNIYPRKLSIKEKNLIFTALPENKPGYREYREIIEELFIVGNGRFGDGNLFLAEEEAKVDLEIPSSPILAIANISYRSAEVYLTVHEIFDGQIEIDINSISGNIIPDDLGKAKVWTYSTWVPGEKAPQDKSTVREIHLIKNEIVLVIAPSHKKIWVYNSKSGINHFIPVSNYYNEVMLLTNNKDPNIALQPGRLFTNLKDFSDEQLTQGFLVYNKHWDRIELDYSLFEKKN
jgi:hypothetical protein